MWVWLGGTSPDLDSAEAAFERAYSIDPENEQASLGLRWVRLRRKVSLADIVGATVPVPGSPIHGEHIGRAPRKKGAARTEPIANVVCPNCGKENASSERFCVDCGQELPMATPGAMTGDAQGQDQAAARGGLNRAVFIGIAVTVLLALSILAYWYFQLKP